MPKKAPKTYRSKTIRLTPRDDRAIRQIIERGYAANESGAIKVALQRFAAQYASEAVAS